MSGNRVIKQISMRESILTRGMWTGSSSLENGYFFIPTATNAAEIKTVRFIPALYKCFDEILVNAIDHHIFNAAAANPAHRVTRIDVAVADDGRITVRNDGPGLQVKEIDTVDGRRVHVPQMAFTEYLAGSNNEDTAEGRVVGGQNGLGAKIVCVYSADMYIETVDVDQQLFYQQIYRNTRLEIFPPNIYDIRRKRWTTGANMDIISKKSSGPDVTPHTLVSFLPAFASFDTGKDSLDKIIADLKLIAAMRAHQTAAFANLTVTYNGEELPKYSFDEFCATMCGGTDGVPRTNAFACVITGEMKSTAEKHVLNVGISYCDENKIRSVSLINGIYVNNGGFHIERIKAQMVEHFRPIIERAIKEAGEDKPKKFNPAHITNHLFIVVRGHIPDPVFNSQIKDCLSNSKKKDFDINSYKLPTKFLNTLWTAISEQILPHYLKTNTGPIKKRVTRKLNMDKYEEAKNCRVESLRSKCSLLLTEGDSAAGTATTGLTSRKVDPNFNSDWYGVYILRGVVLNGLKQSKEIKKKNEYGEEIDVFRATSKSENYEHFVNLMTILNLDYKCTYETVAERKLLRYGCIVGLTDQDLDGDNIFGLIATFFLTYWPALVRQGYVQRIFTPVIRAFPPKRLKDTVPVEEFYSETEYRKWIAEKRPVVVAADDADAATNGDANGVPVSPSGTNLVSAGTDLVSAGDAVRYRIEYYKGLGGHDPKSGDVNRLFTQLDKKICKFIYDEAAIKNMQIFYGKSTSLRKDALKSKITDEEDVANELSASKPISAQFTYFTKKFQQDNLFRKLIDAVDGLVVSRRKVLFTAMKHAKKKTKVAGIASDIVKYAEYHHGEASITATIVNMVQTIYRGQLPLFIPYGNFGTLDRGFKNPAAARYIFTKINAPLVFKMFRPEDEYVLEYEVDEGKYLEPRRYAPIVPYALCERQHIPATGWDISTHAREVVNIIAAVRQRITSHGINQSLRDGALPMFRGQFRGEIRAVAGKGEFYVGTYTLPDENTVIIHELPPKEYSKHFLKGPETSKKAKESSAAEKVGFSYNELIEDYDDLTGFDNGVHIVLHLRDGAMEKIRQTHGTADFDAFEDFFKLKESIQHRLNMINREGQVQTFNSYEQIFDDWFIYRKAMYEKRLGRELILLRLRIELLVNKERYSAEHMKYKISKEMTEEEAIERIRKAKYTAINESKLNAPRHTAVDQLERAILGESASFDYLLNMRDRDKTSQSSAKRLAEIESCRRMIEAIEDPSQQFIGAAVWLAELAELESAIERGRDTKWLYAEADEPTAEDTHIATAKPKRTRKARGKQ